MAYRSRPVKAIPSEFRLARQHLRCALAHLHQLRIRAADDAPFLPVLQSAIGAAGAAISAIEIVRHQSLYSATALRQVDYSRLSAAHAAMQQPACPHCTSVHPATPDDPPPWAAP